MNEENQVHEGEVLEPEIVKINEDVAEVDEGTAEIVEVMDREAAEKLTKDIQSTTTALYVLLKKAHETKAWLALGYKSWTEYIENEFDFSRARSYQLINQANVIEEINKASGVELYITERDARSIKKRLPEITKKLNEIKNDDLSDDEAKEKVREVIEESKDEIDNSELYDESNDNNQDVENDDDYTSVNEDEGFKNFTEEDQFIYDRLIMTLEIFDAMPNPTLLGEKIKKSGKDFKELTDLLEDSLDWLTKVMDELE